MKIGKREVGFHKPPYIIAEAGANHNGSLEIAKKLIFEARKKKNINEKNYLLLAASYSFSSSSIFIYSVLFFSFKDFNLEVLICCNLSGLANKPTTNEFFETLERLGS